MQALFHRLAGIRWVALVCLTLLTEFHSVRALPVPPYEEDNTQALFTVRYGHGFGPDGKLLAPDSLFALKGLKTQVAVELTSLRPLTADIYTIEYEGFDRRGGRTFMVRTRDAYKAKAQLFIYEPGIYRVKITPAEGTDKTVIRSQFYMTSSTAFPTLGSLITYDARSRGVPVPPSGGSTLTARDAVLLDPAVHSLGTLARASKNTPLRVNAAESDKPLAPRPETPARNSALGTVKESAKPATPKVVEPVVTPSTKPATTEPPKPKPTLPANTQPKEVPFTDPKPRSATPAAPSATVKPQPTKPVETAPPVTNKPQPAKPTAIEKEDILDDGLDDGLTETPDKIPAKENTEDIWKELDLEVEDIDDERELYDVDTVDEDDLDLDDD